MAVQGRCAAMWRGRTSSHTLGVPVLAGRDFDDSDTADIAARGHHQRGVRETLLPEPEPAGTSSSEPTMAKYQMTVVGVVKNHKYRSIDEEPIPMAW